MNYFTSDLHLGHKNIAKYRDIFSSVEEHDEYILSQMEKLNKRDILFVLGDFLFDGPHFDEYIERIHKMDKFRIKLVMGNHDSLKLYNKLTPKIEIQLPLFSYKNKWISHAPIHPDELRNREGNIHGHLHKMVVQKEQIDTEIFGLPVKKSQVPDERYFNVNLDVNDYKFVNYEEIKTHFDEL